MLKKSGVRNARERIRMSASAHYGWVIIYPYPTGVGDYADPYVGWLSDLPY